MSSTKLQIGVHLSNRGWLLYGEGVPSVKSTMLKIAERAEDAGYHSVWVGDSVVSKTRFEALTLLAALAAKTERVRIGVTVLLPALRHPIHVAHQTATIDQIADGRLTLAFGAGGGADVYIPEWEALGVPYQERGARMDETIDICRKLWQQDHVTHQGRFFQFQDVSIDPKPAQKDGVPILTVCGQGGSRREVQMKRVVERADGWMTATAFPEHCEEIQKEIEARFQQAGRDPETIQSAITLRVNINDNKEQARDEFEDHLMRYYNNHKFWYEVDGHHVWGPYGSAEYVKNRIQAFADVGIKTVIVLFTAPDQAQQLERFTKQVLPHFI